MSDLDPSPGILLKLSCCNLIVRRMTTPSLDRTIGVRYGGVQRKFLQLLAEVWTFWVLSSVILLVRKTGL